MRGPNPCLRPFSLEMVGVVMVDQSRLTHIYPSVITV